MTPTAAPDLAALRAAAEEADVRFQLHYDACPTVRIGRSCVKCDQLDADANYAERLYRQARRERSTDR